MSDSTRSEFATKTFALFYYLVIIYIPILCTIVVCPVKRSVKEHKNRNSDEYMASIVSMFNLSGNDSQPGTSVPYKRVQKMSVRKAQEHVRRHNRQLRYNSVKESPMGLSIPLILRHQSSYCLTNTRTKIHKSYMPFNAFAQICRGTQKVAPNNSGSFEVK